MMRSTINALDDGISGALEFIAQTAFDQPPYHRTGEFVAMKGKAGNIRFAPCPRHCAMHRFDDVATRRKLSQCLLEAWPQAPAAGRDLFGQPKSFQLGRPADH